MAWVKRPVTWASDPVNNEMNEGPHNVAEGVYMSMRQIAQFLKVNGALDGERDNQRWLSVPESNFKLRYQLWQSDSGGHEMFEARSKNRARNGLMSRFML